MVRWARLAAAALALAVMLTCAPAASADLPGLLATCQQRDAKDNETTTDNALPYFFCDDGVPAFGGRNPNPAGLQGIEVPSAYSGPVGLPAKDAGAVVPGEDPDGDITIDADLSLPDPARFDVPATGYPLVVMMHGCCSGNKTSWEGTTIDPGGSENWHYNNAWFASRGYAVLTYTARGFVNGQNRGSTGETQLDSDRFEINDYQHLAGQLADTADLNPGTTTVNERIDPQRIVPTGGSYGGGFSWMALTDPTWPSPGGRAMEVVAVGTKYGWTNLVDSLVPNGADRRDTLPTTNPATAAQPLGFPKQSINAALYASGNAVVSNHTTFPPEIDQAQLCLTSTDPFESNPACTTTLSTEIPRFINERSAYYQNDFFSGLANQTVEPVPVFSAGTFTDQLFPAAEHRRMVERLKQASPDYPVQEYYGDYNHFVQNKRKEWADLCGGGRDPCTYADYPGGNLNADPPSLVKTPDAQSGRGVTTRLNRFIDHYAAPPANQSEPEPTANVTGSVQVCPENAGDLGAEEDEAGPRFTAPTFAQLAPFTFTVLATGQRTTASSAFPNDHATNDDPFANSLDNGGACPVENSDAGPGVATYDSEPLTSDKTMMGMTRVTAPHSGTSLNSSIQLNARLYDVYPDGSQVLVDRGVKRLTDPNGTTVIDLHGNGWRFEQGHRIRIELAQDDEPYIKAATSPSSLTFSGARLDIPVREAPDGGGTGDTGGQGGTGNGPAYPLPGGSYYPLPPGSLPRVDVRSPRLASDERADRRFTISIRTGAGTARSTIASYQLQIRDTSVAQASVSRRVRARPSQSRNVTTFRFRGRANRTYRVRARAFDRFGRFGPWDGSVTVVPLDLGPARTRGVTLTRGWGRPRSRRAYGGRLRRAVRRGRTARFTFRGDRLYIVGRTGRRGGKAQLTLNGRRRTISFFSRRTRNRRVVATMRSKRRGVNRARILVLGRKGARSGRGTRVELDALGYRRP